MTRGRLAIAATVIIAFAALTAAVPAHAQSEPEFQNERQLILVMRVELENAEIMQEFFKEKADAASRSGWEIMKDHSWRRFMAECKKGTPGTAEKCRKIEEDYQDALRNVRTLIRGFEAAAFLQSLEVEHLRNEYATAVANYITQAALQAATLPPAPPAGASPSRSRTSPTVKRRPPAQQAAPGTRRRPSRVDLSETARRLQALQPLSGRGF